MKCLSVAFTLLALATRRVVGLDITISGTQDGEPVSASELTFSKWEEGTLGVPVRAPGVSGNNKVVVAAAANPTAGSINWCGSINKSTASNRVKSITGAWQHPNCRVQTDKELRQAAAPWVGISNGTAVLQAGSYCQVKNWAGKVDHFIWWQWFPHGTQVLTSFAVAPGDWLMVNVTMNTTSSATIEITNYSKASSRTVNFSHGTDIVGTDAIWVFEAPILGSGTPIYPRFDDAWITEAAATLEDGSKLGIIGATQWGVTGQCRSWEYDDRSVELIQLWPGTSGTVS